MNTMSTERTSKYIVATQTLMRQLGHATNTELLDALRHEYPELSATTVHRITTRMVGRGELQLAPSALHNLIRYDYNVAPHDHFICNHCDKLRDANLDAKIRPLVEKSIGEGCSISGSLTVSGICKTCQKEGA